MTLKSGLKIPTLEQVRAEKERRKYNKIKQYFPESGPHARQLYIKHNEFFEAGKSHKKRVFLAGNRVGKSLAGCCEDVYHLTGRYPEWWQGRRFTTPVRWWVCGTTHKTTRNVLQRELMGSIIDVGSGLIPKETILAFSRKSGVPEAIDTVRIRHVSGGESVLIFKSYEEGLLSFESDAVHGVHLDEEPDLNIYISALMRTMTTDGIIYLTETPLKGMTELLVKLHDPSDDVHITTATWDDAPHLTQEQKDELWRSIPEFQRDARARGIPQLGSGAIYPILEDDIKCDPFEIPKHWKRGYGMDVGWNFTAACWMAHDADNDVLYVYGTYKGQKAEPSIHSSAIKSRGNLKGFIDPASRGRSQVDGTQLINLYASQGLNLSFANNAVEAGLYEVWERLSTGRIKIFSTEKAFFEEYRLYRRDDKGKIVKEHDHILDAFRYAVMAHKNFEYAKAEVKVTQEIEEFGTVGAYSHSGYGWMA